jgi:cyclopropane-fatty-acyl-phospholipid synthase
MTEVGNLRLAGVDERAPMLSRAWDPRMRILARLLDGLRYGSLSVTLPNGRTLVRAGREPGPEASVVVHKWRALRRIVAGGDIGLAQAWIDGDWSSMDLTALIRLAARNLHALGGAQKGSSLSRLAFRLRHLLNANTRRGSARNIVAHYDLGNDFFRLWLDDAMLYSSALWDGSTPTLEAAQSRKVERIRDLLAIKGGERILEIGCGWGALAVRLAQAGAAHVAGLTISPAQFDFARALPAARGSESRVEFQLQDYRDIDGLYDRVVSIEMVEAVGEAWWPTYFAKIARSMKPGGRAVLQAITIAEEHFDDYRRTVDFIQRYIFPGGCLPSKSALHQHFERAGLRLVSQESFGLSYAQTLAEWRRRFHACWPEIAALGFDDRFRRLWDYYLSYCAAGFLEGVTDVGLYCVEHASAPGGASS